MLFVATVSQHFFYFHMPCINFFKNEGYEVHLACSCTDVVPNNCDKIFDIGFMRSPFNRKNISAYKKLKKIINEGGYEIIHCHTPVGGILTRLAARKARKKDSSVFYTAHGYHFFKGAPLLNWIIYFPLEFLFSRMTDCLININSEDFNFSKAHFHPKRLEHIHGVGYDCDKFFPIDSAEKQKLRKRYKFSDGTKIIIYVAEINKNKNQILLLKMMERFKEKNKDILLLLVGPDNSKGEAEKLVKNMELEKYVRILGSRNDVDKLLKISDIAVASSFREGLPVNVLEALATGLPVVATDNRGHRELIKAGYNGYLTSTADEKEIYKKVCDIIYNPNILKAMSANALKSVVSYTKIHVLDELKNIYCDYMSTSVTRVLHVLHSMNCGGAENLLMNIYRSVDRTKIQFDFLVNCFDKMYFEDEILKMGGRIYRMKFLSSVTPPVYSHLLYKFFKNHREIKIIHSHLETTTGLILKQAKRANVPFRIAHSHNSKYTRNDGFAAKLENIYKNHCRKLIEPNATALFTCSELASKWLYPNKYRETVMINNGIDVCKYRYSEAVRNEVRKELGINETALVVGHVGRFNDQKNHMFLIDILESLIKLNSNIMFLSAGEGDLFENVKSKVKDKNLNEKVKFLGLRSDINRLMQAFDVFVLPSKFEGLCLVMVEAQAAGLKCLCADTVTREVDMNCNLVKFLPIDNPSIWANEIISCDKTRIISDRLVADAGFDIKTTADMLEDYYLSGVSN